MSTGVCPLRLLKREWAISESVGAKAARKGFAFAPNLANAAVVIQGATLDAELAACGDIFAPTGLTEMVTTYVILLRTREAHALLLLRAFFPYLFRVGSPLNLLRHRLASSVENSGSACAPRRAMRERQELADRWGRQKKLLKVQGVEWGCFGWAFISCCRVRRRGHQCEL